MNITAGKSRRERRRRRGAVALEFVLLTGVLLLLIVGTVELGRAIMVRQVLVNAAREGARRAVVPGATDTEVVDIVNSYMTHSGIAGQTIQISPALSAAASHQAVTVRVSVLHSQVSWGFTNLISGDAAFVAEVVMRKE
jgi:Flp pilus assembly protein TadG